MLDSLLMTRRVNGKPAQRWGDQGGIRSWRRWVFASQTESVLHVFRR